MCFMNKPPAPTVAPPPPAPVAIPQLESPQDANGTNAARKKIGKQKLQIPLTGASSGLGIPPIGG